MLQTIVGWQVFRWMRFVRFFLVFFCMFAIQIATKQTRARLLSLLVNLEHQTLTQISLPALSPVLQIIHSSASMAEAIALARTYFDWLPDWWMTEESADCLFPQLRLLPFLFFLYCVRRLLLCSITTTRINNFSWSVNSENSAFSSLKTRNERVF